MPKIAKTLKIRMAVVFGFLVVLSLTFSGVLSFVHSRKMVMDCITGNLAADVRGKRRDVIQFIKDRAVDIQLISQSRYPMDIINYILKLRGGFTGSIAIYEGLARKAHEYLKNPRVRKCFDDLVIVDAQSFYILYTLQRGLEGKGISTAQYESLRDMLTKAGLDDSERENIGSKTKQVYISDIVFYEPLGQPCMIVACPIVNEVGHRVAVVVGVVSIGHLNRVVVGYSRAGDMSETYLVGDDGRVRSSTVFLSVSDVGKKRIDSEAVKLAFRGNEGVITSMNYRGKKVVTAYAPLKLKQELGVDFDWVILSEVDYARALSPVRRLAVYHLVLGLGVGALAMLISYLISRSLVNPITRLRDAVSAMAGGDLNFILPDSKREDEVGELIRDFRRMQTTLKNNTGGLIEGVHKLATAVNELSATSTELATGAAETSASAEEVVATAEEMRQVARHSMEKAKNVSTVADNAVRESYHGREAADEVINGLENIHKEMDFLASSIMKLGEQSRSIGIIIDTVKDLADQVNILSVNAAIEAARAGEYGKGFSVVAQEMRSLAEQSREATDRIKEILTRVQDSASEAVIAVERGTKAILRARELGAQMGETIKTLVQVVQEAADSALQISASNQEQLTGVEQVVEAMQAIQEAIRQNTEAARQLEGSVHDLAELSNSLKKLSEAFKI